MRMGQREEGKSLTILVSENRVGSILLKSKCLIELLRKSSAKEGI
jgi:hypothetical protein